MEEDLKAYSMDELEDLAATVAAATAEIADRYRTGRGVVANREKVRVWMEHTAELGTQYGAETDESDETDKATGADAVAPVQPSKGTLAAQTAHWLQNQYQDYNIVQLKKADAEGDPYAWLRFAIRYDYDGANETEVAAAADYYKRSTQGLEAHCAEAGVTKILIEAVKKWRIFTGSTSWRKSALPVC